MSESFIINRLENLAKKQIISFHVPGHKNGKLLKKYNAEFYSSNMISLDSTELSDTDNLHAPKGIIKQAQERAAQVFKADHSFFLVNGTTSGNISALMTVLNPDDKVIIPRDSHKSIMYGLIMGGYIPVYVNPEVSEEWGIPAGIKPENIERAILENPQAKAVLITYPNYYGICSDITTIAEIVKKYNKILIVDEAHGAHFILSDKLPISSIVVGADIVMQSTHKTLPAFTQASMLHVKSDKIDINRLRTMLMMNQSSSPSYLLMSSLDVATDIVKNHGSELMNSLLQQIAYFKSELKKIQGVNIIDEKIIGKQSIKDIDKTRLVINMTQLGISGIELSKILRAIYNIQVEMADINNIVAIASIGNSADDIKKLLKAIKEIANKEKRKYIDAKVSSFKYLNPCISMPPREACFSKKENVVFKNSFGKISGEYIIPYPPGIPILCPGEIISKEVIQYVFDLKKYGVEIIGMEDEKLDRIKVIK